MVKRACFSTPTRFLTHAHAQVCYTYDGVAFSIELRGDEERERKLLAHPFMLLKLSSHQGHQPAVHVRDSGHRDVPASLGLAGKMNPFSRSVGLEMGRNSRNR